MRSVTYGTRDVSPVHLFVYSFFSFWDPYTMPSNDAAHDTTRQAKLDEEAALSQQAAGAEEPSLTAEEQERAAKEAALASVEAEKAAAAAARAAVEAEEAVHLAGGCDVDKTKPRSEYDRMTI